MEPEQEGRDKGGGRGEATRVMTRRGKVGLITIRPSLSLPAGSGDPGSPALCLAHH